MKLISFSIWGQERRFVDGALANIKLARIHYLGWRCRIYCGISVPASCYQELYKAGFQVRFRAARFGPCEGLFWRFEPASDPGIEAFISRDLDSRLNPREAAAVNEWLASGKRLHTMRDHYEHIVPILGGMWGCRPWPEFGQLMNGWKKIGHMGDDQDFLKERIWPLVKDNDCIQHDLYTVDTTVDTPNGPFTYKPSEFFGGGNLRQFPPHEPMEAHHGKHVGSRIVN